MKEELKGDTVFDTGVLIELLKGTEIGSIILEPLRSNSIKASTTELNMAELNYILCRKVGWKRSFETMRKLRKSGYIKIHPITELLEHASKIKCQRTISLVDCFTITLAERMDTYATFARHEHELDRELNRSPFKVKLLFLEDLKQHS
jgi:predicted nucleic acid-binding protein